MNDKPLVQLFRAMHHKPYETWTHLLRHLKTWKGIFIKIYSKRNLIILCQVTYRICELFCVRLWSLLSPTHTHTQNLYIIKGIISPFEHQNSKVGNKWAWFILVEVWTDFTWKDWEEKFLEKIRIPFIRYKRWKCK